MSVHNGQRYLTETVNSVLNQSFEDFEFIIVDDGSTDASRELLSEYSDSRIRVILKAHSGLPRSLNVGLKEARGTWIARIDADDLAEPHRLERQLQVANQLPGLVLLGSDCTIIDDRGQQLWQANFPEDHASLTTQWLEGGSPFPHASTLFNRLVALKAGGYNPRFRRVQDLDLWLRLSSAGQVASVPEPLLRLRKHDDTVTVNEADENLLTFALAAIICHLRRNCGSSDPSSGSDQDWRQFFETIHNRVSTSRLLKSLYARNELRTAFMRESGGTRLSWFRLIPLLLKSPGLYSGAFVPRYYRKIIHNLAAEMVS